MLARETTDPLAAGLLRDIISELEADPLDKLTEDGERRNQKSPLLALACQKEAILRRQPYC